MQRLTDERLKDLRLSASEDVAAMAAELLAIRKRAEEADEHEEVYTDNMRAPIGLRLRAVVRYVVLGER